MPEILQPDINNAARRIADHLLDTLIDELDPTNLAEWLNVGTDDVTADVQQRANDAVRRQLNLLTQETFRG